MSLQGQTNGQLREHVKERIKIKEPKQYRVIMHNDDFTSMEFVVDILMHIFHKDPLEAERLMLLVHKSGRAAVGAYPYDLAVTKVQAASDQAKKEGFPFRMTVEEA